MKEQFKDEWEKLAHPTKFYMMYRDPIYALDQN